MTSFDMWFVRAISRITGSSLGTYQAATVRIGFSATWLLFLLREFPHRQELYGPDGPWSWSMAHTLIDDNGAFTALLWNDGRAWFEIVYILAIVSSALLLVGWHTRAMSVLFMVGVLSLENRSIFMSDGGDNVIHLMSIYLVLTRCGAVWSLDARRARLREAARARGARLRADAAGPVLWWVLGVALMAVSVAGYLSRGWLVVFWGLWVAHGLWWLVDQRASGLRGNEDGTAQDGAAHDSAARDGAARDGAAEDAASRGDGAVAKVGSGDPSHYEPRLLLNIIADLAHNAGLLVIMVEACLIYSTAGWYKIQGSRWQDGTAVFYPLHLDYFSPWPALSHQLAAHGLIVLVITYGTVIVQVAFPFALFNRRLKNVLLVGMMCEHTAIAITLGLPFFSLAMIAADAVFLPTPFLLLLGRGAARGRDRLLSRIRRPETGARTGGSPTDGSATNGAGDGAVDGGRADGPREHTPEAMPN